MGLSSASGDRTYFQKIPFVYTTVLPNESSLKFTLGGKNRSLDYNKDFVILDSHRETEAAISGDLVFVGFGVTAPELEYDDYRGLDVKGKIAVMLMESPASFPALFRGYYRNLDVKRANAANHGVAGIIYVRSAGLEISFPWEALQNEVHVGFNSLRWLDAAGNPNDMNDALKNVAVLSNSEAGSLFKSEDRSLEEIFVCGNKGLAEGFSLSTHADIAFKSRHEKVESVNIIALLEGSDPVLKKEYVVYSSHLDPIGIGASINGDSIYNGAIDNAGGCADLLELIRAYSSLPKPPQRSMVFLFTTAEEGGLLGADYFAHYPSIPVKQIIAAINVDEPMSLVPVSDVIGYGAELSSLGATIQQAAIQTNFTVSPDPIPEEGIFTCTDVFPMVKKGIPAVYITVGTRSTQQGIDGLAVQKKWMVTNYHMPSDDISQPIDFETAAKFNRFLFLLGYNIANTQEKPAWNKGGFFGNKFSSARD